MACIDDYASRVLFGEARLETGRYGLTDWNTGLVTFDGAEAVRRTRSSHS
jgi:hypothetical protein